MNQKVFSSSTTKSEKQTSQNIASKIKANEAQITAEIINLISSNDTEYESNFFDSIKINNF